MRRLTTLLTVAILAATLAGIAAYVALNLPFVAYM